METLQIESKTFSGYKVTDKRWWSEKNNDKLNIAIVKEDKKEIEIIQTQNQDEKSLQDWCDYWPQTFKNQIALVFKNEELKRGQ